MVLRVRGSTGSLGKLTLQRDCGVSWRYQAIELSTSALPSLRVGVQEVVGWGNQRNREEPRLDSRALGISVYDSFQPPEESLRSLVPPARFLDGSNSSDQELRDASSSPPNGTLQGTAWGRAGQGLQLHAHPVGQTHAIPGISRTGVEQ